MREIVILRADAVAGDLLRRCADGAWPDQPDALADALVFESIGFAVALAALYARTRLPRE